MKPDICIYHAPCQDGFTAAWAIWRRWPDVEFVAGIYGEAPPNVTGRKVLIVDFSYKLPVLLEMAKSAASITILDHHKSAQADLGGFDRGAITMSFDALAEWAGATGELPIQAEFDMDRSGAMLAWDYAWSDEIAPEIVRHVQDRDLWRFKLPETREIAAVLFSLEYDFEAWNRMAAWLEIPAQRQSIVAQGEAIERKHHKDVGELLDMTQRYMVIGGHRVPVANLPYTMSSDAANRLAEGNAFGACYYDNSEGRRCFSLRSKPGGADVSVIAAGYGGGGHAQAAGFAMPRGWEGDDVEAA